MTYLKNLRQVSTGVLLAGFGAFVLDGCKFDDRDLEERVEENSCDFAYDGNCDEPNLCERGTDTADCEEFGGGDGDGNAGDGDGNAGDGDGDGDGDTSGDGDGDAVPSVDNSCTYAADTVCDEPEICAEGTDGTDCHGLTPGPNDCRWANDDVCDVPADCAPGSDTNDCTVVDPDSCTYALDGVCDEPLDCDVGTDTTDCDAAAEYDSCTFAMDGVCDEPLDCAYTTDSTDCNVLNSCATAYNGICDETCDGGTDVADCLTTSPVDSCVAIGPCGDAECPAANNGLCEEGMACAFGSDATDCATAEPVDTCTYAFDGYCDEYTEYCDAGTDQSDCRILTASSGCNQVWAQLGALSERCLGSVVQPTYCQARTEEEILALFVCAHEAMNVTCEDYDAGLGLATCDALLGNGNVEF